MEEFDEAEKIIIGKCAFKAYSATNFVCTVLAIINLDLVTRIRQYPRKKNGKKKDIVWD